MTLATSNSGASVPSPTLFGIPLSEAIEMVGRIERDLGQVDALLLDGRLLRDWTAVGFRSEALAASYLDGLPVDAEQLARAQRDPGGLNRRFALAVDSMEAVEFGAAQEPTRYGVERWFETVFRRARWRTADLLEFDLSAIRLTPAQAAKIQEMLKLLPVLRKKRIGVSGSAETVRRMLAIARTMEDLENTGIPLERREAAEREAIERNYEFSERSMAPGLIAGRLFAAWYLRQALGLDHTPLFSNEIRKNQTEFNQVLPGREWGAFWLRRMVEMAERERKRAKALLDLRRDWDALLMGRPKTAIAVAEGLVARPFVTTPLLRDGAGPGAPTMGLQTAQDAINVLVECKILSATKLAKSPRVYRADKVLPIL